jgi:hypothetical protein
MILSKFYFLIIKNYQLLYSMIQMNMSWSKATNSFIDFMSLKIFICAVRPIIELKFFYFYSNNAYILIILFLSIFYKIFSSIILYIRAYLLLLFKYSSGISILAEWYGTYSSDFDPTNIIDLNHSNP